jgi:hypothetical protein
MESSGKSKPTIGTNNDGRNVDVIQKGFYLYIFIFIVLILCN